MVDIYLINSYSKGVNTTVKEIRKSKKKPAISLEENIFYPGGGGQPPDIGTVYFEDSSQIPIYRVLKMDGEIFLALSQSREVSIDDHVYAKIDWNKRYAYMRCHTAAHVVMGTIRRNIENYTPDGISISEGGDCVTVKFKGYWTRSEKEAKQFIEVANEMIRKDSKVIIKTYKSISVAINEFNEIYRGPRKFSGEVRIVIIDSWDANPCGGTHVNHLGEIEYLELVSFGNQDVTFSLKEKGGEDYD
jgi:Ser-tRNA(Ala) deacylase AlaX